MVIVIMFVERNGNERHPDGAGRREAKMPHDAPELPPNLVHDFTKNQEKLVRETKSRAKVLGGKALSEVTPLPRKTGSQGKMCKICQHTPLCSYRRGLWQGGVHQGPLRFARALHCRSAVSEECAPRQAVRLKIARVAGVRAM